MGLCVVGGGFGGEEEGCLRLWVVCGCGCVSVEVVVEVVVVGAGAGLGSGGCVGVGGSRLGSLGCCVSWCICALVFVLGCVCVCVCVCVETQRGV